MGWSGPVSIRPANSEMFERTVWHGFATKRWLDGRSLMLAQIMKVRLWCEENLQAPYVSRRLMALVRDDDRQRTPKAPVPAKDEFVD